MPVPLPIWPRNSGTPSNWLNGIYWILGIVTLLISQVQIYTFQIHFQFSKKNIVADLIISVEFVPVKNEYFI